MSPREQEAQRLLADSPSADSQAKRCKRACIFLLTSQFLERIAFYSLVCNLVFLLNENPYDWNSDNAMIATLIFTGFSFCSAVFGGWLADSVISKFRVIIIGYVLALCFYIIFPFMYFDNADGTSYQLKPADFCIVRNQSQVGPPWDEFSLSANESGEDFHNTTIFDETCSVWVVVCLIGVGIGDAFIRSNISPFGADQFYYRDPDELRTFFSWYYWILNVGALVAYILFAYIQQNVSVFWGYMIPYIMLVLSGITFVCGQLFYVERPSHNTTLGDVFGVLGHGLSRLCSTKRRRLMMAQDVAVSDVPNLAASGIEDEWDKQPGCLSLTKIRYGGRYPETTVNDVRTFLQVLGILVCLIFYFLVYFQMESTFTIQGLHMKVQFDQSSFIIPVAWLTVCDVLTVIILLPLINGFLYPWLDRVRFSASLRARMLTGMLFSVLAMVAAGLVEHYRLQRFWGVDNTTPLHPEHVIRQRIGNTTYYASDMPICWQVPQYVLVGLGEIFTSVAGLELAYSHAPRSMQALVTGLFWLVTGCGSLLGTLCLSLFRNVLLFEQDHTDINCRIACGNHGDLRLQTCYACHLDYYFYVLAIMQMGGMFLFALVAWVLLPRSQSTLQTMRKVTHSARSQHGDGRGSRRQARDLTASVRSAPVGRDTSERRRARRVNDSGSSASNHLRQQHILVSEVISSDTV